MNYTWYTPKRLLSTVQVDQNTKICELHGEKLELLPGPN